MNDTTQVGVESKNDRLLLNITVDNQTTVATEPILQAYQKALEHKARDIEDVIFNFQTAHYLTNLVPLIHQLIDACVQDQNLRFTLDDGSRKLVEETVIPVSFKDGNRRWGFFTIVAVDGDVAILDLAQAEIITSAQQVLKEAYLAATDRQARTVIFNFSNYAPHISSAGISTLILLLSEARSHGQQVIYTGVAPYYKKIFNLVGLPQYVDFYPSIDEALEHLRHNQAS